MHHLRSLSVLTLAASLALTGCDKIKAMTGRAGDAGTENSGGVLGVLKPTPLEGSLDVLVQDKSKTPVESMTLHLQMKADKIRVDIPTSIAGSKEKDLQELGTGYAVILAAEKKIYVVLDKKKQVIVLDLAKLEANAKAAGGAAPAGHAPTAAPVDDTKVTKTGKLEKIAGYDCEDWDMQAKDGTKATVCMAKALSFVSLPLGALGGMGSMLPGGGLGGKAGLLAQLFSGSFPLKMVAYDAKGVANADVEATKIDKGSIDDARFGLPPGYTQVDLAQMLGGLGMPGMLPQGLPHHR